MVNVYGTPVDQNEPPKTAADAAAIAGAQVQFRGTYGGASGAAYNDYVAMYNQQQAQLAVQQQAAETHQVALKTSYQSGNAAYTPRLVGLQSSAPGSIAASSDNAYAYATEARRKGETINPYVLEKAIAQGYNYDPLKDKPGNRAESRATVPIRSTESMPLSISGKKAAEYPTTTLFTKYDGQTAVEKVKIGYVDSGQFGAYQQNAQGRWLLVSSGSRAALQGGGMTVGKPQDPRVWTQESAGTVLSDKYADKTRAAEVLANRDLYSRPGAEAYGGYGGVRLDNRTIESSKAQLSTYANPYNLANLVSPQAVNLPKAQQVAMGEIPYGNKVNASTPTIFRMDAGVMGEARIPAAMAAVLPGVMNALPEAPAKRQTLASPDMAFMPAYKGMDQPPGQPIAKQDMKTFGGLFVSGAAVSLPTEAPAGYSRPLPLSTYTKSEAWLGGVPVVGSFLASLPAGKVVAAVQDASIFGNLVTGRPFTRSTEGDKTLGNYQEQYVPTSKVENIPVAGWIPRDSAVLLKTDYTTETQPSPLSHLAGGKEDFQWKMVPMNRLNEFDSIPWIPSKGETISGGTPELFALQTSLPSELNVLQQREAAFKTLGAGNISIDKYGERTWVGSEAGLDLYNTEAKNINLAYGAYSARVDKYTALSEANPILVTKYDMSKTTVTTGKTTQVGESNYGYFGLGIQRTYIEPNTPDPKLVLAMGNMAVTASGIDKVSPGLTSNAREVVGWGAGAYSLFRERPIDATSAVVVGTTVGLVMRTGLTGLTVLTGLAAKSSLPIIAPAGRLASSSLAGYAGTGFMGLLGGSVILSDINEVRSQPTAMGRGEKGTEKLLGYFGFGIGMGAGWKVDASNPTSRWYNPHAGKGFDPLVWVRGKWAGTGIGSPASPGSGGSGGTSTMSNREWALRERLRTGDITLNEFNRAMKFPKSDLPTADTRMSYEGGYAHPVGSRTGGGIQSVEIGDYSVLPERLGIGQKSILPTYRGNSPTGFSVGSSAPPRPTPAPSGTAPLSPKAVANYNAAWGGDQGVVVRGKPIEYGNAIQLGGGTAGLLALPEGLGGGRVSAAQAKLATAGYGVSGFKPMALAEFAPSTVDASMGMYEALPGAKSHLIPVAARRTIANLELQQGKGNEFVEYLGNKSGISFFRNEGAPGEVRGLLPEIAAERFAKHKQAHPEDTSIIVVHSHETTMEGNEVIPADFSFSSADNQHVLAMKDVSASVILAGDSGKHVRFYQQTHNMAGELKPMSGSQYTENVDVLQLLHREGAVDLGSGLDFSRNIQNTVNVLGGKENNYKFFKVEYPKAEPRAVGQQRLELYGVDDTIFSPTPRGKKVKVGKAGTSGEMNYKLDEDFGSPIMRAFPREARNLRKDIISPATFERIPSRRGAIVKVGGKYQTMPAIKPDLLLKVGGAPAGSVYEGSTVEIFAPKTKDQFFDNLAAYDRFHELTIKELRATDYTRGRAGVPTDADAASILSQSSIGDYHLYAFKGEELHILRGKDLGFLGTSTLQTRQASLDHIAATVGREGIGSKVLVPLVEQRFRDVYGFRQYEVQSANNPRTMQFYAGKVGGVLDKANPSDRIFIKDLYLKKDVIKPQKKYDMEIIRRAGAGVTILAGDTLAAGYTEMAGVKPVKIYSFKDTGHTVEAIQAIPMERKYYETGADARQSQLANNLRNEIGLTKTNNPNAPEMMHAAVDLLEVAPSVDRTNVSQLFVLRDADKSLGAIAHANIFENELSINNVGAVRGQSRQSLGFGGEMAFTLLNFGEKSGAYRAILTPKNDGAQNFWEKWGFNEQAESNQMVHNFNTPAARKIRREGKVWEQEWKRGMLQKVEEQAALGRILGERPSVAQELGREPMGSEFVQVLNLDTYKLEWRRRTNDAEILRKDVIQPQSGEKVGGTEKKMQLIFTKYKPQTELDIIKSERSKQTYKPSTTAKQQAALSSEQFVARLIGGETTPRFHPVDVLNVGDWGVEVKTVFPGAHEKMTMHGYDKASGYNALESKRLFVEGRNQIWSLPSGVNSLQGVSLMRVMATNKIYVKEGFGSYRSSAMTEVTPSQIAGMRNVNALNELLRKDTIREAARKRKNLDYPTNVYKLHTQTVTTPKTEIVEFTPKYKKLPAFAINPTEGAFPMFPFGGGGGGESLGGGGGGGSAAASSSSATALPKPKAKATQKITTYSESKVDTLVASAVGNSAITQARVNTKTLAQIAGSKRAAALAASEARARARMEADLAARSKAKSVSGSASAAASRPKTYNKMLYDGSDESAWETVVGSAAGAGALSVGAKSQGLPMSMPRGIFTALSIPRSQTSAVAESISKSKSLAVPSAKSQSLANELSRTKMLSLAGATGLATAHSLSNALANPKIGAGALSNVMPYTGALSGVSPASRSIAKADTLSNSLAMSNAYAGALTEVRPLGRVEPKWEPKWEPRPTPGIGGIPVIPPIGFPFPFGGGGSAGGSGGRAGRGGSHREVIPIRSEFENYGMGSGGHKLKKRRR